MTGFPAKGPVVPPNPADGHGDTALTEALEAFTPCHRELISDLLAGLASARNATAAAVGPDAVPADRFACP